MIDTPEISKTSAQLTAMIHLTMVAAIGRVAPGATVATKAARTVYHGSYEGLGTAWSEFRAWIVANGHVMQPDLYEYYLTGPESSVEPADWRTELQQPLAE